MEAINANSLLMNKLLSLPMKPSLVKKFERIRIVCFSLISYSVVTSVTTFEWPSISPGEDARPRVRLVMISHSLFLHLTVFQTDAEVDMNYYFATRVKNSMNLNSYLQGLAQRRMFDYALEIMKYFRVCPFLHLLELLDESLLEPFLICRE